MNSGILTSSYRKTPSQGASKGVRKRLLILDENSETLSTFWLYNNDVQSFLPRTDQFLTRIQNGLIFFFLAGSPNEHKISKLINNKQGSNPVQPPTWFTNLCCKDRSASVKNENVQVLTGNSEQQFQTYFKQRQSPGNSLLDIVTELLCIHFDVHILHVRVLK